MEALVCKTLGDPTGPLSSNSPISISTSHPIPPLNSPTDVRVRIRATSLNYANFLQILGKYQDKPPLPFIPGSDYSGVVVSVGDGVSRFKVGDRVCSFAALGTFAEMIVADEKELYVFLKISSFSGAYDPNPPRGKGNIGMSFIGFLVPDGCDLVDAAALPVAFGTSHVALVHRAQLSSGQVLLVLGAAGGVGLSAVQIGKVCGAIVIAVARGEEKVQFLKSLGVDHIINSSKENVIESCKGFLKARNSKGVDVLYDPVGGKLAKDSLKLLKWGANILVIGFASGEVPVIPANIALVKNWTVHGLFWGSYKINQPKVLEDSLKELLSWLAKGLITIHISHNYSLKEANLAFSAIKERKAIGKVMITLDDHSTTRSKL